MPAAFGEFPFQAWGSLMNRLSFFLVALLALHALATRSIAQDASGIVPPAEATALGLQRMWFTQIEVDVARGRVLHITQHVSTTQSTMVYEVVHPTGKFSFRETDIDLLGNMIGRDEAKKRAEVKLSDLKSLNIDAKPAIQLVPKITLYAATDSGLIQAIDAETGRTRWKTSVGTSRYPTEAIGANDKFAVAVNGSTIYVLNAENGELVWERKVDGAPGAGPAVTESLVFVPMIDGAMEAYPLAEPRGTPAIFKSHGRAMIQPTYTGSHVAWPTDRGHLYVTAANSNHINFRLEARGSIVTPASFYPPNRIITSSTDGFVYCIQETVGTLLWRFSAGEPIAATPVAYGDSVYTVTQDGSLYGIDGELGLERWSTGRMSQVIGASRDRLFCLNDIGRLTILDRRTGTQLGSLSTEFDDLPYINRETDRIVIGTSRGLLQCFRESNAEYPLVHYTLNPPAPEPERKKPTPKPTSETPATDESNPFGAPTGSATDSEPEAPPPAENNPPAAPLDDPFG